MTEQKELTVNPTITLHLKTLQWNSIFSIMGRLGRTTEVAEIFKSVQAQTEGKDAEEFDIALTMEQANLILDVLKLMPFYLVHDLIMEIVEQGRAEIGKVEAEAKAKAKAEAKAETKDKTE